MLDFYDYGMTGLPHGYDPMEGLSDEDRLIVTCLGLLLYTVGLLASVLLCALIF